MEKVHEVVVDQLSLGELGKIFPSDYQHLCVKDAKAGLQLPKTFFVGVLQDAFQKISSDSVTKKRLTLREVLTDGKKGEKLDVFTYDDYANAIDQFLKIPKNNQNLWIAFSCTKLVAYQGYERDGWCSFSLRVGLKSCEAQMWLVTQAQPVTPATAPLSEVHINEQTEPVSASQVVAVGRKQNKTINECMPNRKATVFAVVNQIVKPPQVTFKGTHHMLLALVDPSCLVPGAQRQDMLVHVFLNDTTKPNLTGGVERGDIVLMREMTLERFCDKVHGKVYNNKQVVKFSSDLTAQIKPVTEKDDYILTDTDCKEVIELRHWWEKVSSQLQVPQEPPVPGSSHGTEHEASSLSKHTISEINQEMTFTLYCQVVATRLVQVESQKILVFRVRDGTPTTVYFSQYDFQDATQNLLTQTESCTPVGSLMVDILMTALGQDSLNIMDDSFVCLKNIQCMENDTKLKGDFSDLMFDLSIQSTTGNVIKLPPSHSENLKIIRRLAGGRKEETNDCNNSIVGLVREGTAADHAVSPVRLFQPKPSPNRIDSQPLGSQRMSHPRNVVSPSVRHHNTVSRNLYIPDRSQNLTYNSHSHFLLGRNQTDVNADAGSKVVSLSDLPSNTQRSPQDLNTKDGERRGSAASIHSENMEVHAGGVENDSLLPSSSSGLKVQQDMSHLKKNNQGRQSYKIVKRKLPMDGDGLDYAVPSPPNTKQIKTVLVGDATDSTLEKVVNSKTGVVYRISALVKKLYYLTSFPCETCPNDSMCTHNWVWGLCETCMQCYPGWRLREKFSPTELQSHTVLPCLVCSPIPTRGMSSLNQPLESTCGKAEDGTRVSGTLEPVLRLKVQLSDPQSGFTTMTSLSGDNAKQFTGAEPKFAWLVGETQENLANLMMSFVDYQKPLVMGIQKLIPKPENNQYNICNTILKCIDE